MSDPTPNDDPLKLHERLRAEAEAADAEDAAAYDLPPLKRPRFGRNPVLAGVSLAGCIGFLYVAYDDFAYARAGTQPVELGDAEAVTGDLPPTGAFVRVRAIRRAHQGIQFRPFTGAFQVFPVMGSDHIWVQLPGSRPNEKIIDDDGAERMVFESRVYEGRLVRFADFGPAPAVTGFAKKRFGVVIDPDRTAVVRDGDTPASAAYMLIVYPLVAALALANGGWLVWAARGAAESDA